MKLILREVQEASALFDITAVSDYLYRVEFLGPADSLYENVNITLYYKYKANHPFSFPVIFFRPILFHPNVDEKGILKISALDRSPAETLLSDLLTVVLLLHEPHICEISASEKGKEEIQDGYEQESANLTALHLWRHDKEQFETLIHSSVE